MKDGKTNGKAGYIDNKEHGQLPYDGARARVRVCPNPVEKEIADNGANKGNCPRQSKGQVEKLRKQVHNPEIYNRTNCSNGNEPDESRPLS